MIELDKLCILEKEVKELENQFVIGDLKKLLSDTFGFCSWIGYDIPIKLRRFADVSDVIYYLKGLDCLEEFVEILDSGENEEQKIIRIEELLSPYDSIQIAIITLVLRLRYYCDMIKEYAVSDIRIIGELEELLKLFKNFLKTNE